ncbi:MAG: DUF421 domain-containing protein [Firmicutes bacterium]|nr:DUF421 domain-containing protein [Bacillota bacterium]
MLIVFARVIILYAAVLFILRLSGKQQVSTLQPFELVTIVLLADVAAIPMATTGTPLINGLVGLFALLLSSFTLSFLTMKSARLRSAINGRPTVVVANGRLVEDAMRELRYSINDLLEQLRLAGYPAVNDVEFAVLETNGQLSVIPKSQRRPVMPADLGVPTSYEGLPTPLIVDGKVDRENLRLIRLDMDWLHRQIRAHGVDDPEAVLYAALDTQGRFFCQPKGRKTAGRLNGSASNRNGRPDRTAASASNGAAGLAGDSPLDKGTGQVNARLEPAEEGGQL